MSATRKIKSVGVAIMKRNVWVRSRYRAARGLQRSATFRWHARGRPDAHLVVFESFMGRSYAGSPRALYEQMLADPRFADCRFAWSLRDPAHAAGFPQLADPRTTIVRYRRGAYYRAFGQAAVWVGNSIIAGELRPRPMQTYVQTWHGTPLKRIGMDVVATTETAMNSKAEIDVRYRTEARKITHFISACAFSTDCFASAFGLPRDVLVETGNPRNDPLALATPADTRAARARLGIAADKRVVLYAPTWRDDQHSSSSGYVFTQPFDLASLRKSLGDDYVILFRAHYLVTNSLDLAAHRGFVLDVSNVDDVNELCLAADLLVTDYSSVYFDYALLDRPMIFHMYDLDRYDTGLRGLYLPADDVPGPITRTQDELVAALLDPQLATRDAPRRAELVARMAPHEDGHAGARVLDLVAADLRKV